MIDKYVQQANQMAALMAKGKTLRQAAAIVARRWAKKGHKATKMEAGK